AHGRVVRRPCLQGLRAAGQEAPAGAVLCARRGFAHQPTSARLTYPAPPDPTDISLQIDGFTQMSAPRTLYDKIFDDHVVQRDPDGTCLLYIDRHLVHEVTSPQAFEGLRMTGRRVRHPEKTLAVVDHNVPTSPDRVNGIK